MSTARLGPNERAVLEYVVAHPGCSGDDLAVVLGVPRHKVTPVANNLYVKRLITRLQGRHGSEPSRYWPEALGVRTVMPELVPPPNLHCVDCGVAVSHGALRCRKHKGRTLAQRNNLAGHYVGATEPTEDEIDATWEANAHLLRPAVARLIKAGKLQVPV